MSYELIHTKKSLKDLEKLSKSGNNQLHKKIKTLLSELKEHPTTGTGKPERLKHHENPTYSRRINKEHRLIYEVPEETPENEGKPQTVLILSAYGHYQ